MAWADAVSIVRELGIREPGETGPQALPSTANHAASYSPRCAEVGNHQKNWLAYFSSHIFDAASIYWRGIENHAGTVASLHDSRDARYVHSGGNDGETQCTGCRGWAPVPAKNAINVSSARR